MSRGLLHISKRESSTTSLNMYVPVLSHTHSEKVFPLVEREPPVFNLCSFSVATGTTEKGLGLSSLPSHFRYLQTLIKVLLETFLLQAQQSQLSVHFLIGGEVQPLNDFNDSSLGSLQFVCVSLLSGVQNWTHHSRCGHTRAKQRGRITFLHLLATLILMQSRTPLVFLATRALWLVLWSYHVLVCKTAIPFAFL